MSGLRGRLLWRPAWVGLLLACNSGEPAIPSASGATPGRTPAIQLEARGIRTGVTTEDGRRREIQVDAVRPLPGRIGGLRAPALDGLTLEGLRVIEDGVVVAEAARVDIDPFAGSVHRQRALKQTPEVAALVEALGGVIAREHGAGK